MPRITSGLVCFAVGVGLTLAVADPDGNYLSAQPKVTPKPGDPKVDPKAKTPVPDPKGKTTTPDPKGKAPAPQPKVTPKPPEPKKVDPPKPPMPKPPAPKPPEPPKVTTPTPVEEPPPEESVGRVDPFRLAQGLRDAGMADVALEYLADLKGLTKDQAAALPLERAKCKLALANDETEEAPKAALVAEARADLRTFTTTGANHPQAAEGTLTLARLTLLDAKSRLQKAKRSEDDKQRKADAVATRPAFEEAAKLFADAAAKLAARAAAATGAEKRRLERERAQAELDTGINQFELYNTFIPPFLPKEVVDRGKTIDKAKATFDKLAADSASGPVVWTAKAWAAECLYRLDKGNDAKAAMEEVAQARGYGTEAGKRLVGYFDVLHAPDANLAELLAAEKLARGWLTKFDAARRPTPESVHVKYLLGLYVQTAAENAVFAYSTKDKDGKVTKLAEPRPAERARLQEAERLFRQVMATENDYTNRAAKRRSQAVRVLLGDADKVPAAYTKFDDAHMAALVHQTKVNQAEGDGDDKKVKEARAKLIAMLERARDLAGPKDPPADVNDDGLRLAFQYLKDGRTGHAAVLGEHLARTVRGKVGKPAVAGFYGVLGYLGASAQVPPGEEGAAARAADRERAVRLAQFVEKTFPSEAITDDVRYRLGSVQFGDGKLPEAFATLARVRGGSPRAVDARLLEGAVAYQLLVVPDSPLTDPVRRKEVYEKAIDDLEKVPAPAESAASQEVKDWVVLRVRLAGLHMIKAKALGGAAAAPTAAHPEYAKAEDVANAVLSKISDFTGLTPEHRLEVQYLAADMQTRAKFLEGRSLFEKKEFDKLFAKIKAVVDDAEKSGPAAESKVKTKGDDGKDEEKPLEGSLAKVAAAYDTNRRDVVVLAIKARIREGNVAEATKLLDVLEKLGGSLDATILTLQQLSGELRGQILLLRKDKETEAEATKMSEGFTELLAKLATKPGLKPSVRVFIGQSYTAVDQFEKAAEELAKVPAPDPKLLATPFAQVPDESKDAVRLYRAATLFRMRALRQSKNFAEADALVKDVLGPPPPAPPGWGNTSLDFRKESYLLWEAKGAENGGLPAWQQALKGWTTLANAQFQRVKKMQDEVAELEKKKAAAPADQKEAIQGQIDSMNGEVTKARAVYHEYYFETQRCAIRANQKLLAAKPDKLKENLEREAKKIFDLESRNPGIDPGVVTKYFDLLDEKELAALKEAYKAAGGKAFLQRPDAAGGG